MNATTSRGQTGDDLVRRLGGAFAHPNTVNQLFDWVQARCHLISPSTICPVLPPGFAVTFNIVRINAKTETYPVGGFAGGDDDGRGKRGLGRVALFRLENAAEISWDPDRSYRVDDGKEPNYCHWHAVGVRRTLSGDWKVFDGDGRMDLRDGGAQWQKIMQSVRMTTGYGRDQRNRTPEEIAEAGRIQVRDFRAKLLERTQTCAKLRALRNTLGIRTYDASELQKPWVVATLIFTGKDEDPKIERENKAALRDRFLGGASALFAASPPRARALPIKPPSAYQLPAVSSVRDEDDYEQPMGDLDDGPPPSDPGPIDVEGEPPCDYCGSFEDVRMVSTKIGEIPVCSNRECDDRARGEISPQAQATAGGPPATHGSGTSRTRSSAPPPPMGNAQHQVKAPSTPPPPDRDGCPPPPRGSTQERYHGTGTQPRSGLQIKVRGGRELDIEDATDGDLQFWRDLLARKLSTGSTPPKFRAKDQRLLDAIINEQASRSAPY